MFQKLTVREEKNKVKKKIVLPKKNYLKNIEIAYLKPEEIKELWGY